MRGIAAVHLPAIFQWPEAAEAGGVAAYGPRFTDMFRQRARMVVKILRGASPTDIPVEQPARFELVINLGVAKAIGLDVPASLVARGQGCLSPVKAQMIKSRPADGSEKRVPRLRIWE